MLKKLFLVLALTPFIFASYDDRDRVVDAEEFSFARLVYSGTDFRRMNHWATDYPKADRQFLLALRKLTDFGFIAQENKTVAIMSPELFKYPFVYAVEVGYMRLSDEEAARLREYLLRGGLLVVDDFHGTYQWRSFYSQMKKVFPEYEPVELDVSHPIFHCYFDIEALFQVPGLQYVYSGRTWERDGYEGRFLGIHDDKGRLLVVINHNSDLGDAWEWFERPDYPEIYSNQAIRLGVNYIIYALTH